MLIWALRGSVGLKYLAIFHVIILASGLPLYFDIPLPFGIYDHVPGIVIALCVYWCYKTTLKMIRQKSELKFATISDDYHMFPRDRLTSRLIYVLHFSMFAIMFYLAVVNLDFDDFFEPRKLIGISIVYYLCCLGVVGIMIVKAHELGIVKPKEPEN